MVKSFTNSYFQNNTKKYTSVKFSLHEKRKLHVTQNLERDNNDRKVLNSWTLTETSKQVSAHGTMMDVENISVHYCSAIYQK